MLASLAGCLFLTQLRGEEQISALNQGKQLFAQSCILCHGSSAKGDGVLAVAFKPANLLADSVQQKSDSTLSAIIRAGRSPMPAFGHQYDDDKILSLVIYLRFLARYHQ